jgi:putative transposase
MKFCPFWLNLFAYLMRFLVRGLRSKTSLAAENLFLRKETRLLPERKVRPRRIDATTRLTLV